jgi:hypothetical protein
MFLKSGWRMTGLPSLSKQSMLATHAGRLFFEPGTRNSFVPSPTEAGGRGLNLLSIIPKVWNYAFWTLYWLKYATNYGSDISRFEVL